MMNVIAFFVCCFIAFFNYSEGSNAAFYFSLTCALVNLPFALHYLIRG